MSPMERLSRDPKTTRENRSRPRLSVPAKNTPCSSRGTSSPTSLVFNVKMLHNSYGVSTFTKKRIG